jgi:hypothetical protein
MSTLTLPQLSLLDVYEPPLKEMHVLTEEQSRALRVENIRRCKADAALPEEQRYGWRPLKRAHQSPARRAKQAARAKAFFEAKDQQNAGFSRVA